MRPAAPRWLGGSAHTSDAIVMSINVQAYGAPARLTLRDYQIAGTAVTPHAPPPPPTKTLDSFTPSDRTAAPNTYVNDSLRNAALRRDAAPPAVGETDRATERPPGLSGSGPS
jgi:hypothetical protein